MRARISAILLAAVAGVAVAAAVGTAVSQDAPRSATLDAGVVELGQAPPRLTPPASMPATLADTYGVLRRDRLPADDLPSALAHNVTAGNPFGAAPDLARLALRHEGVIELYAVPAARHLCVVSRLAAGEAGRVVSGCTQIDVAARSGVFSARYCLEPDRPGHVLVAGLAPDGVQRLELRRGEETIARAAVTGNAYFVAGSRPDTIAWQDGGHKVPAAPVRC